MTLVVDLAAEFGWPHDFWRRIGWLELGAWTRELGRRREAQRRAELEAAQRMEIERQRAQMRR